MEQKILHSLQGRERVQAIRRKNNSSRTGEKKYFSGVKKGAPTKRLSSKGPVSKGPGMNGPASKGSEILKVRQRKVRPHNIRQEYFDTKRPKYIYPDITSDTLILSPSVIEHPLFYERHLTLRKTLTLRFPGGSI
jgi:hypothetical protein